MTIPKETVSELATNLDFGFRILEDAGWELDHLFPEGDDEVKAIRACALKIKEARRQTGDVIDILESML